MNGIFNTVPVDETPKSGVVTAKSVVSISESETKETTPLVLPLSSKYTKPSRPGQLHFQDALGTDAPAAEVDTAMFDMLLFIPVSTVTNKRPPPKLVQTILPPVRRAISPLTTVF